MKDRDTPILKQRLIASVGFLVVLMYFSMGHAMWGWPVPAVLSENYVALGLIQLLLTVAVMIINQKFFISGFKSLLHRAPNMDTLVALVRDDCGADRRQRRSRNALYARVVF